MMDVQGKATGKELLRKGYSTKEPLGWKHQSMKLNLKSDKCKGSTQGLYSSFMPALQSDRIPWQSRSSCFQHRACSSGDAPPPPTRACWSGPSWLAAAARACPGRPSSAGWPVLGWSRRSGPPTGRTDSLAAVPGSAPVLVPGSGRATGDPDGETALARGSGRESGLD